MAQKTNVSDFIIYGAGMDPKTFHMLGKHTNTGVTSQPMILSFHLIFFFLLKQGLVCWRESRCWFPTAWLV